MLRIVERLDLQSDTHRALEHIARLHGVPPWQVIEHWVQRYQQIVRLHTPRQEYQGLIDRDLNRIGAYCLTHEYYRGVEANFVVYHHRPWPHPQ